MMLKYKEGKLKFDSTVNGHGCTRCAFLEYKSKVLRLAVKKYFCKIKVMTFLVCIVCHLSIVIATTFLANFQFCLPSRALKTLHN